MGINQKSSTDRGLEIEVCKVKGVPYKPLTETLILEYLGKEHRNFKILAPTPHNTLSIMEGRDKNFGPSEVRMPVEQLR